MHSYQLNTVYLPAAQQERGISHLLMCGEDALPGLHLNQRSVLDIIMVREHSGRSTYIARSYALCPHEYF